VDCRRRRLEGIGGIFYLFGDLEPGLGIEAPAPDVTATVGAVLGSVSVHVAASISNPAAVKR
jgi:hypothetical protein